MNTIIGHVSQVTFPFQLQESHDKKEDYFHNLAISINSSKEDSSTSCNSEEVGSFKPPSLDELKKMAQKRESQVKEERKTIIMSIAHEKWTEEEDKQLIEFYKQGLSWKEIAAQIPKRTAKSCMNHWGDHLRKRIEENGNGQLLEIEQQRQKSNGPTRVEWTEEEDKDLIKLYKQGLDWNDLSIQLLSGKTSEQCRNHWRRTLRKRIEENGNGQLLKIEEQRQKLIGEQRQKLIEQQRQKSIEQHQNGHMRSRPAWEWTEEESKKLIELYKQDLGWEEIAAQFPKKTSQQCRDHWRKALRKRIEKNGNGQLLEIEQQRQKSNGPTRVEWTEEEDKDLIKLYKQGLDWKDLSIQLLSGKTSEQCRDHWRTLRKRIEENGNGPLFKIEQQRQKSIEQHQNGHKTGHVQWTEEFEEFMKTDQKSLKKRERTIEESEGDRAIKRARMQLSSSIPVSSPPPQAVVPKAVVPTVDFTKGEAFTDLIEPESVSDFLAFFDVNFPNNSEDTFSATSSAETPMHHDNQIMTQQENTDKSYEEYCDFGFR